MFPVSIFCSFFAVHLIAVENIPVARMEWHPPKGGVVGWRSTFVQSSLPHRRITLAPNSCWQPRSAMRAGLKASLHGDSREIGRAHVELQSRQYLVCRLLLEK